MAQKILDGRVIKAVASKFLLTYRATSRFVLRANVSKTTA